MPAAKLTLVEREVVRLLQSGYVLRRVPYSSVWGLYPANAARYGQNPTRRVLAATVQSLADKNVIYVGRPPGGHTSQYLLRPEFLKS